MKGNLQLFWEIASSNEDERLRSANELVEELLSQQDLLASSSKVTLDASQSAELFDDLQFGESSTPLLVDESDAEAVEKAIGDRTVADLMYALRRLLRGLASPRESSRLGFAVVLTELLSRISYAVTAKEILVLVLKYSNAQGAASRQEQKDLMFAKLFGIMSLVQSGLLSQSTTTLGDFKRSIRVLIALSQDKQWMAESCAWVMVSAFSRLAQTSLEWADEANAWMLTQLSTTKEVTSEKVAVLLTLGKDADPQFFSDNSPRYLRREHPLSTSNLPQMAKILREAVPSEGEDAVTGARSRWQPKIHFVWDIILDTFFDQEAGENKLASFPDFYRVVVDESLFAASSSHDRKSWGFQVFERSLQRASDDDKPLLFTPNFMRTLMNQLGSPDRLLHKAAVKATQTIRDVVKQQPHLGFVLVTQLIGTNGHPNFDSITKTKTVEQTLAALDTDRVRQYVKHLVEVICQTVETQDEDQLAEISNRRKWAFDQLLFLVRTHAIPKDDQLLIEVLTYLAAHGYFTMAKSTKKYALLDRLPLPALTDDLRAIARARFLSCVSELSNGVTTVSNSDGTTKKSQGTTQTGELWLGKAHEILSTLEKDANFSTIFDKDEEIAEKLAEGVKCLDKVRKLEAKSVELATKERLRAFQTLLLSALLISTDAADGASDLVEPLCACAERLFFSPKKATKAKKQTDDAPSGMELLCDCLLSFLELSSAFLRSQATHAFEVFSQDMTRESMGLLLSHLQDEDMQVDEEEDDGAESSDESAVVANGKASVSDTSATSEDEQDDDSSADDDSEVDDEEVDEDLRARLQAVLRESGLDEKAEDEDEEDGVSDAGSESSVEFSDLGDDEMLLLDDKLAEVFRQKVAATRGPKEAKKEVIVLRFKVLELIEMFARKQPLSPLMLDLITPVYDLWSGRDEESEQLANKAREVLVSRISKAKTVPTDIDASQVTALLERMHKEARDSTSHDVSNLAQALNVYLTKVALSQDGKVKTCLSGQLLSIYRASLLDYLMRKACRLPHEFLIEAFRRFPLLGWHLRTELLDNCRPNAAAHAFRQLQAMQMLQTVLTQMAQRPEKQEILGFVPDISRCFCEIIAAACTEQDSSLKAQRVKEVIKFVSQIARVSRRIEPSADKLQTLWKISALNEIAAQLQATERFKSSSSIHDLMKQLLNIISPQPQAPKAKKDKKRAAPEGESKQLATPTKKAKA